MLSFGYHTSAGDRENFVRGDDDTYRVEVHMEVCQAFTMGLTDFVGHHAVQQSVSKKMATAENICQATTTSSDAHADEEASGAGRVDEEGPWT